MLISIKSLTRQWFALEFGSSITPFLPIAIVILLSMHAYHFAFRIGQINGDGVTVSVTTRPVLVEKTHPFFSSILIETSNLLTLSLVFLYHHIYTKRQLIKYKEMKKIDIFLKKVVLKIIILCFKTLLILIYKLVVQRILRKSSALCDLSYFLRLFSYLPSHGSWIFSGGPIYDKFSKKEKNTINYSNKLRPTTPKFDWVIKNLCLLY